MLFRSGETDPTNTVCPILGDEKAPRNLNAELLENGKVKLTWEKPLDESILGGFSIYRKASGGEYKLVKMLSANKTEYTDNFRTDDGYRYYYKLMSVFNRGIVESTPAQSLNNPDLCYVEINRSHVPSGLTLEEKDGQLLLQWDFAMLAETYNVYRNGELIAENIMETQYACEADGEPSFYQVSGVLNGVESNRSYKAYYARYAVDESSNVDVALYPNPTNNNVTVTAESLREIKVFGVTGQLVMSRLADADEMTLNLSALPSGVYYFRIATEQGVRIRKVVLVK